MAHVTRQKAIEATEKPTSFLGHPVTCGEYAVIYDDPGQADALAGYLNTYAKHAPNKHGGGWVTFSIVKLPEGWEFQ